MVYKEHGFNLHGFKINTITPGGTSKILNIPDGLVEGYIQLSAVNSSQFCI